MTVKKVCVYSTHMCIYHARLMIIRIDPCQCQEDQVCVITAELEWKCVERELAMFK